MLEPIGCYLGAIADRKEAHKREEWQWAHLFVIKITRKEAYKSGPFSVIERARFLNIYSLRDE